MTRRQLFALTRIDPAHKTAAFARIAFKLRAIDVDKVHDQTAIKIGGNILRHLARKDEDMADDTVGQLFIHPILH